MDNNFVKKLYKKLEKTGIRDSTIERYIHTLKQTSNGEFTSLKFLTDTDNVLKKLQRYRPSTQKAFLSTFSKVLSLFPDKSYQDARDVYINVIVKVKPNLQLYQKNRIEKFKKNNPNWVEWPIVQKLLFNLEKIAFVPKIKLYNIFDYFLLSLYVLLPPERNQDYIISVSNKHLENSNHLDIKNDRFIIINHKTSKKSGTKIIDYSNNDHFKKALKLWLDNYPNDKAYPYPLLISPTSKEPLNVRSLASNLRRLFLKHLGKRGVSSTMLRRSYLTWKYGDVIKSLKKDNQTMGHDARTAINYYIMGTEKKE